MNIIESAYLKATGKDKDKSEEKSPATGSSVKSPHSASEGSSVDSEGKKISSMSQRKPFTTSQMIAKHLVFPNMADSVLLNRYRNLRTNLLAKAKNKNFTTLVTSVVPKGGSSLVTTNLASIFAFDQDKSSILIEVNDKDPSLDKLLEVNAKKGLIDYLQNRSTKGSDIIYATPIERVRLIPSGGMKLNFSEYISSEHMQAFINELVTRYPNRYPFFDAPSISASPEAQILADLCDLVILVVPYGKCSAEEIKHAAKTIGKDKLAGIVLNEF